MAILATHNRYEKGLANFMRRGPLVIVLLVGGDKSTQEADVERAIKMVRDWKD